MPYIPFENTEVQVDKPWGADQAQKVKSNFDYLYGQTAEKVGVFNGSFEIDSDSDGVPDGWTKNLYPGGSGAYETTSPMHGAKSYKFTHPGGAGNGGGYLESDYIEIDELRAQIVSFIHWATAAGMENQVVMRYFDKTKTSISDETVYSSTSNPTSPTRFARNGTTPATARYVKLRFIGGFTDTNVAGTAYFDAIIIMPVVVLASQAAGDYLLIENNATRNVVATVYTKYKETKVGVGGTFRIKFTLWRGDLGNLVYGKIYRNGVAVGTERANGIDTPTTFSEDIGGWSPNDLVQVYCKNYGSVEPVVSGLNIYTAAPPIGGGHGSY